MLLQNANPKRKSITKPLTFIKQKAMKPALTTFIFTLALLFTFISTAEAQNRIWIVNNNPGGAGDFSDFNKAQDAATDGDTLYVVPSPNVYGSTNITKQLHIFGGGYLHGENNITTHNTGESSVSIGKISGEQNSGNNTADGSSFHGLVIESSTSPQMLLVADDISFKRCIIKATITANGNETYTGISIIQSLVKTISGPNRSLYSDFYISNSLIGGSISNLTGSTIINSIIDGTVKSSVSTSLANLIFENNIFISTITSGVFDSDNNNTVSHNIFAQSQPSNPGTNNQFNIDPSTLFIGPDGNSTDAQWQLSESSPAKGAGTNGDDAGMFGGPNPYILSGIPAIPRITEFIAPSSGSGNSGLPVTITIQSEN